MKKTSPAMAASTRWLGILVVLAPLAFLASLPWLSNQPDAIVFLATGIATTIVVIGSLIIAAVKDQEMDEWHRSAARFASQWGWISGGSLIAILLAVPAVHDALLGVVMLFADGPSLEEDLVLMIVTLSFMAVIATQAICTVALNMLWRARMSGPAR
ncbi:hypothetical protein [Parvularcula sp. IMCC14364]|uniref:hypothetical protein n=1 Tax=Parvularcula sp. IMCC14364 TaxID=3067902 RepID=UPI002740A8F5|nr:hypothetical protein [Parvularcula sp. IMCC14364]